MLDLVTLPVMVGLAAPLASRLGGWAAINGTISIYIKPRLYLKLVRYANICVWLSALHR